MIPSYAYLLIVKNLSMFIYLYTLKFCLYFVIVGGNLVSNPNQVLSFSELAARGVGLIFKVLLNPT